MMPNESKLVFVLSFLLTVAFLATPAQSQPAQQPQGQSKEDKTAEEEALRHAEYVEVTATRVPELVADLPGAIEVFSAEDLAARGATDLRSALALAAGIDIAPCGDGGPASYVPEFWGLK